MIGKSSKLVSVPCKYEVSACSRRITFEKNKNKRIAHMQHPSMLFWVPDILKKPQHSHTHTKKTTHQQKTIRTSEFNTDLTTSLIFGRLFADAVELSIRTDTQSGSNVTSPHYVNS